MQFKVIASILLFFVAQAMATPTPQIDDPTRDGGPEYNSYPCMLPVWFSESRG